jgi:hypothetical protein
LPHNTRTSDVQLHIAARAKRRASGAQLRTERLLSDENPLGPWPVRNRALGRDNHFALADPKTCGRVRIAVRWS